VLTGAGEVENATTLNRRRAVWNFSK